MLLTLTSDRPSSSHNHKKGSHKKSHTENIVIAIPHEVNNKLMSGTTPTHANELFQQRKSKVSSHAGLWDENIRPGRRLSWNSAHSREKQENADAPQLHMHERRLSWDGQSNASIPLSQASIPLSRLPSASNVAPNFAPHVPSSVKEISLPSVRKISSKPNIPTESTNNTIVQAKQVAIGDSRGICQSTDSDEDFNYQLLRQSSYYRTNEFLHQKKLIDMHNAQVLLCDDGITYLIFGLLVGRGSRKIAAAANVT